VHRKFQELRSEHGFIRAMVLKARKEGISTFIQALALTNMLCRPGTTACVICHELDASQELLGMSSFFYERLHPSLQPKARITQKSIIFEYLECADGKIPLNSRLIVDTATGKESGRSKTIQFLHLSEVAFYPDPERTLTGILQSVPLEAETVIVMESTANGVGDEFNNRWNEAEGGTSGYEPIFLPWFALRDYRRTPPMGYEPTKDELAEARRYSLDKDQLYWRHMKIQETDDWLFKQEMPATPSEAFVTSGMPAYSQPDLLDYRAAAKRIPYREGFLNPQGEFVTQKRGPLRLWEEPAAEGEYLIAADTSLGVEGGDFSAVAVVNRKSQRVIADMLYLVDPRVLAAHLALLGTYFNKATLAVEVNNTGLTTQVELVEHIRYPRIYRWRRYDNLKNIYTDKLGWETSKRTRPLLIDDMAWGIKNHVISLVSVRAIDQLQRFDAEKGGEEHDDLAMAYMIAWHCHLHTMMKDGRMPRVERRIAAPTESAAELDLVSYREWEEVRRAEKQAAGGGDRREMEELSDMAGGGLDNDPMPEIPW
jgi:hypothetical protein